MSPYKWNRKSEKSMSKRHGMKKILLATNGFQDGKGHGLRNAGILEARKGKEMDSVLESPEKIYSCLPCF